MSEFSHIFDIQETLQDIRDKVNEGEVRCLVYCILDDKGNLQTGWNEGLPLLQGIGMVEILKNELYMSGLLPLEGEEE